MPSRIKPPSLYIDGAKVANLSGGNYSFTNDSEEQITGEGWIGGSDGAVHGKITGQTVITTGGAASQRKIDRLVLSGGYAKMKFQRGSDSYTVNVKPTGFSGEWKYQGGNYTGSFDMICGKPVLS